MTCGFRYIEFFLIWYSTWSAALVATTIYDVTTLTDINGSNSSSSNDDKTESSFEVYYCGYAGAISFVYTWVILGLMNYWTPNTFVKKVGRKSFMIIATQVLKIIIILTTLFTIKERDQMKRKTGDEFIIGIVLWICEYTSIVLELSLESLKEKSKYGIKYFLRNFAELTLAQMVSAQLFDINQNIMLYLAIWESFVLSVYIACKCGRTSPYWLLWVGIAVGFVQGLILQRAQFNSSEEVVNYIFLFVLTLNLPIVKNAYEKLEIPPEYKYSYHKSLEPNADTDQNKPANSTESTNAQLQPVDAV